MNYDVDERQTSIDNMEDTLFEKMKFAFVRDNMGDAEAIKNFQWKELFYTRRSDLTSRMELFFLGHALLDKARTPYIGMTGHGILVEVEEHFFSLPVLERIIAIDERCCHILSTQQIMRTRDLNPFPILGFPGFDVRGEDASFYDNTRYFRLGRRTSRVAR